MAKLDPRNNKIILQKIEQESSSSLFIPDSAKNSQVQFAKVIKSPNYYAGEIVLYHKQLGFEVEHEGEKFVILDETQILAVVE